VVLIEMAGFGGESKSVALWVYKTRIVECARTAAPYVSIRETLVTLCIICGHFGPLCNIFLKILSLLA